MSHTVTVEHCSNTSSYQTDRHRNTQLAFDVAEQHLGIPVSPPVPARTEH